MGNFPILGPDHDSWSPENDHDLLAIHRRETSDPFSRWLINSFVPWFHNVIGKRFKVRFFLLFVMFRTAFPLALLPGFLDNELLFYLLSVPDHSST